MRKGILLLVFVFVALMGQAQKLIVNEVSQGPIGNGPNGTGREYVELLVAGTPTCTTTTLDLRGWIVDDNNGWVKAGSGTGIANGAIRFKAVATWQAVPYGSIILIYNDNDKNAAVTLPNDPTDANNDKVYVLPASSNLLERNTDVPFNSSTATPGYAGAAWSQGTVADSWGTVALRNGGDAMLTVDPAAPNVASFSFAYGDLGPSANATVYVPLMDGGNNAYLTDANYNQSASWQQGVVGTDETPGAPNTPANAAWINSMRAPAAGGTAGTLSSSNGTTLCMGATTTLSSTSPGGTWTSSNPAFVSVTAAGVATAVAAGTATLTYTVGSGSCLATAIININVIALANAGTVSGGPSVCTGQTVTYSSNGTTGGTWSVSPAGIATINPATGVATGVTPGSATVTYAVGSGACAASATAPLTVVQTPVVAPITGNNTVCVGSQVTLTSATSGGNWNTSDPGIVSLVSTGGTTTAMGVAPGTATITYIVTNGSCQGQQTFTITVNALPVVPPPAGPSTVCLGSTISLSATPAGGTWSSADPGVASVNAFGTVTGVSAGAVAISYTVTQAGCTAIGSKTITVAAPPALQPTTGPNTVCFPGQVQLTNPAVNGSGQWTATPGGMVTLTPSLVTGGPSMVTVTALAAGVATINFTVTANGCSSTVPFVLTINAAPVVAPVTGANTVCVGSNTTFSSATPGGTWSSSDNTAAPISNTGVINGVTAGTYTITYTVGAAGCTGQAQKSISVSALPVVNPTTGNGTVCVGGSTQLTNGSGVGVSSWSSSNTGVATVSGSGLVTGVSAGTAVITFSVLNAEGCTASVPFTVTVTAPPVLGPIVGGGNLCSGTTLTLSHPTPGGTWSSSNTAAATVSAGGVVNGVATGSATITYTISNGGCTAQANTSVSVVSTPNPGPISGNNILCIGSTSTLAGSLPGGTWSSGTPGVATVNNTGLVTALTAGTTQVAYTVSNSGCTGVANINVMVASLDLQLAASPNPAVAGQPVTFTSSANIPYTVTAWRPAGVFPNNTATTQTITASQSGEYYVVAAAGGCIDTARVNLVVTNIVNDLFVPNYFTPNGDGRNDVLYIYGSTIAALDFRIFNQWGEAIFASTDKGRGWDGTASGRMQPVGVYMYVAKVTLLNGEQKTLKGSINLIR